MDIHIQKAAIHNGLSRIVVTGIDNSAHTQEAFVSLIKSLIYSEMMDKQVLVTQIEGGIEIRYAANAEQIKYLEEGLKNQQMEGK